MLICINYHNGKPVIHMLRTLMQVHSLSYELHVKHYICKTGVYSAHVLHEEILM